MRILIIEDDQKIAKAIKKGLELESFAVDLAYEGGEGSAKALNINYDLIIIDRMIPGASDGIKICQLIREKEKNVPILILTAKDKVRDRVEGLNAGADDYLVKPFAFEELLARIKALLRRPNKDLGSTLKSGDLELDTVNYTVKRGKKNIRLSATEFSLLEYMMRNPGRILTKNNIIEHVWDYDADILPNTIEVYINYLRKKIDRAFPKLPELIKTIRGFGYRLDSKKSK